MLLIYQILRPAHSMRKIADEAGIAPESLSRIVAGKQQPSFAPGGSAERIAGAIGWRGDPADLFREVE